MPRKKKENIEGILEKLEYLGLDLDYIPEKFKNFESLGYKIPRFYDEKKYRQYRYVNINDIQILLSPTNRMDDLSDKYKKASPLYEYLDKENEKNIMKYTKFLEMLKAIDVQEIKKIEKEQKELNRNIPFKVKFHDNYLWQIYYSENTDKYFMIVPTEDSNYSTFFYLLKKQIEGKKGEKIFVPIVDAKYSNKYLKSSEFEDIENYLWLFTKDWPSIYEVYNKQEEMTIQIIGETNVYEKVKTLYKVELKNEGEANEFYKLLKALFIIQNSLPDFYNFETDINKNGCIEFYFEGKKIEYKNLVEFIREQYKAGLKSRKEIKRKIRKYKKMLKKLQDLTAQQEIEYLAKEKQISTFLECKKTFFGKFKYYFKYSKKKNNKTTEQQYEDDYTEEQIINEDKKEPIKKEKKKIPIKKVYTLEELIESYKELEKLEKNMKNLLMDVNALKLKTKNLAKKIENATKFIEEIDNHKKSIFEFWKYSNKDEIAVLPEGEKEEINVIKKIEKTFSYEEDLEKFGEKLDKMQRKNLNNIDLNSIYIATTNIIDILNKIKTKTIKPEDIEDSLKNLKKEQKTTKELDEEEYDIFGNIIENSAKTKKINNKKHREIPKDKFNILDINKNTKTLEYKNTLQETIKNIVKALQKGIIPENMPIYIATDNKELKSKELNIFNINPEDEMKEAIKNKGDKINLYKINIKEETKGIGFTNIIFYDNQNRTLPIGMDLSTKMLVDISKLKLELVKNKSFKITEIEDEDDDFSNVNIKDVEVFEYEVAEDIEENKKNNF